MSFKIFNHDTNIEYDATSVPEITWGGESYTTTLYINEVTGIQLENPIYINVGETVDLSALITYTPTNATAPNTEHTWYTRSTDLLEFNGDILSTKEASSYPTNGQLLQITMGNMTATTFVYIRNLATSITLGETELTVNVGESALIEQAIANYTLTPANANVQLLWETEDETIVAKAADNDKWTAMAKGDTKLVAYAAVTEYDAAGGTTLVKQTPEVKAELTIHVKQPVTGIVAKFMEITGAPATIPALSGDNLTAVLAQLYTVLPANASNPEVEYEIINNDNGALKKDNSGNIVADAIGMTATIRVKSVENSRMFVDLPVSVERMATAVKANEATKTYEKLEGDLAIEDLGNNITFTPAGSVWAKNFSLTSSDASVLQIGTPDASDGAVSVVATAKKKGTATVTAAIDYTDVLQAFLHQNDADYDETAYERHATATFTVSITQGVYELHIDDIYMAAGESVDLKDYVHVNDGADVPEGITFSLSAGADFSDYVKLQGSTLTALKGNMNGIPVSAEYNSLSAGSNVYITEAATGVTAETSEITVNVDDWQALTAAMNGFKLNPESSTDELLWEIADTNIVEELATVRGWNPKAVGTTTLTAYAAYRNSDGALQKRESVKATLKVTVKQGVESLSQTVEMVRCLPGDNLSAVLDKLYTVEPANATNKNILEPEIVEVADFGEGVLVKENGAIMAKKAGTGIIRVTSEDNNDAMCEILVDVVDIATKVEAVEAELSRLFKGEQFSLGDDLVQNLTFTPEGTSHIELESVVSSNSSVVDIESYSESDGEISIDATVKGVGEATITTTISYTDFLNDCIHSTDADYDPATYVKTSQASFVVRVAQGLYDLDIDLGGQPLRVGVPATFTITPVPAGVAIDASKLSIVVNSLEPDMPADWEMMTLGTPVMSDDGAITVSVSPLLPGSAELVVSYAVSTEERINPDPQMLNVVMPATLVDGWQWTSFVSVSGNSTVQQLYGNDIIEIRSQDELMARDENGTYFGYLTNNMEAGVAYKVKGSAARLATGENVTLLSDFSDYYAATSTATTITLRRAWTWIACPYLHSVSLQGAISGAKAGDRITSKKSFADFADGNWSGSLTSLTPGEAYLYYNNEGEVRTITWAAETSLVGGNDEPVAEPSRSHAPLVHSLTANVAVRAAASTERCTSPSTPTWASGWPSSSSTLRAANCSTSTRPCRHRPCSARASSPTCSRRRWWSPASAA